MPTIRDQSVGGLSVQRTWTSPPSSILYRSLVVLQRIIATENRYRYWTLIPVLVLQLLPVPDSTIGTEDTRGTAASCTRKPFILPAEKLSACVCGASTKWAWGCFQSYRRTQGSDQFEAAFRCTLQWLHKRQDRLHDRGRVSWQRLRRPRAIDCPPQIG